MHHVALSNFTFDGLFTISLPVLSKTTFNISVDGIRSTGSASEATKMDFGARNVLTTTGCSSLASKVRAFDVVTALSNHLSSLAFPVANISWTQISLPTSTASPSFACSDLSSSGPDSRNSAEVMSPRSLIDTLPFAHMRSVATSLLQAETNKPPMKRPKVAALVITPATDRASCTHPAVP
jgi:hypothetical protein